MCQMSTRRVGPTSRAPGLRRDFDGRANLRKERELEQGVSLGDFSCEHGSQLSRFVASVENNDVGGQREHARRSRDFG